MCQGSLHALFLNPIQRIALCSSSFCIYIYTYMYICVSDYSMCSSVCAHAHVSLKHFTLALPNSAASVDRALMDRISLALAVALAVDSPPRLPRPFGGPSESSHCIRFGAKSKVVQVRNTLTRVPHYLLQLVLELETIRIHIRTRTRLHSHTYVSAD